MIDGAGIKHLFRPLRIFSRIFLVSSLCLFLFPFSLKALDATSPETAPEEKPKSEERFRFGGELRQETAYRLSSPHNFTKIKEIVKLDFRTKYNDHIKIKLGGRAYYDAVYDLTDQFPDAVNSNMKKEVRVRDAYLDFTYPKVNIRLGSQQIVWGEALGQFFADVVTPKDLREFFLPAFEEVRIPIWALDIQYNFIKNGTLEFVVTPDLRVDKIPLPGSEFAFFIPPPPPGVEQILLPDNRPTSNFKRWNGGLRVSYLVDGWDLAWFYYTTQNHVPALYKTLSADPNTGQTLLTLNPRHPRLHQFGTTFSKGAGPTVVRGEFVLTPDYPFNAADITQNAGIARRNQLRYMIGVDYPIAGKVSMNFEFQQQAVLGSAANVSDRAVDSWIFLRFETGFLDETVVPELIFIVGLNKGDTEISPRIHYHPTKSVTLTWGVDIFTGPLDTLYGEFRDHDRVYMNTSFKF